MNKKLLLFLISLIASPAMAAMTFNGSNNWTAANAGVEVGVEPTTFTISCRVLLFANQTARQILCNPGANDGTTPGLGFGIDDTTNNKIKFYTANTAGTASNNLVSNGVLANNAWYSIICLFRSDASGVTNKWIYINGVLDNSVATTTPIGYDSGCRFSAGAWSAASLQFLNGKVDDIREYNYLLSNNEIQTLAQTNVRLICSAPSCLTYNRMDDGRINVTSSGASTVYDLTGNGIKMTPSSLPVWSGGIMGYP